MANATLNSDARPFTQKALYRAKVVKQSFLLTGKDDIPALFLTFQIEGKLVDDRKPDRGVTECQSIEGDVMLRFPAHDDTSMGISMETLEDLGFDGDDLEDLNPANPKHRNFVGETVYVSPTYKLSNDAERCYWNLRFPSKFADRPIAKGGVKKTDAAARYRELLAERRATKQREAGGDGTTPF